MRAYGRLAARGVAAVCEPGGWYVRAVKAPAAGRRVAAVEVVPLLGPRRSTALQLACLPVAYVLLLAASAVPSPRLLVLAAIFLVAVEFAVGARVPIGAWALSRIGLGPPARTLLRGLALVLFAGRALPGGSLTFTAIVLVLLGCLAALRAGASQAIALLRAPPLLSRGLALGCTGVPPALPLALHEPGAWLPVLELPAVVGLALASSTAQTATFVGLGISLALAALWVVVLGAAAAILWRRRVRKRVAEAVTRAVAELRPQIILYFGGDPSWRYQVEMWLEAVEQLERPALVLVRDREVLSALAPTTLPIVCVPNGSALTALELPDARVSLFVANTGDSMHLLRHRTSRSVFVGHGDSDKAASTNPFTRVYDEIWVAGQAGRDRYRLAAIGVVPERIVEVGRPELGPDLSRTPPGDGRLTVLYAPTWEGWGDDPFHTSLALMGPLLVEALLAVPGVRVLFRPHPLGGSRDPAVRRATDEVEQRLRAAGAAGPESVSAPPGQTAAGKGDLLDSACRPGTTWSRAAHRAAVERWTTAYWSAVPAAHRILTAPAPDLHDCFAVSDTLIADVSSVATEWLLADRPYAVLDGSGGTAEAFRSRFPSAAGAVLLRPDLVDLPLLLDQARGGPDPLTSARQAARRYLLGPSSSDPIGGLRQAVDRLCELPNRSSATTSAPDR